MGKCALSLSASAMEERGREGAKEGGRFCPSIYLRLTSPSPVLLLLCSALRKSENTTHRGGAKGASLKCLRNFFFAPPPQLLFKVGWNPSDGMPANAEWRGVFKSHT